MKFNKWTLGLAALGVVSLASAVKAEEKQNFLQTALSSTTISGYVDTSVEWTVSANQSSSTLPIPFRSNKQDGFNLNVVKLSIEKPLDESEWAAGYKVDLLFGPDAAGYNTSVGSGAGNSDFGIKQAYVALRAPIGNGVEFKVGSFDTIIGYEVFEAGNNPNFTRSWGYAVEPTEHTGILASYRVSDIVSLSAGVANTLSAGINNRNTGATVANQDFWQKTYMGSVALTAPQSWGWAAGSSFYAGVVSGFSGATSGNTRDQNNYYAGLTLNTPVAGLKVGLAYDYVRNLNAAGIIGIGLNQFDASVYGVYASFQATPKLSLHGRAEFISAGAAAGVTGGNESFEGSSYTLTAQYDLWQNVISRLEARYDAVSDFDPAHNNTASLYANIIYKF